MTLTIGLDRLADGPVNEELTLQTEWCAERLGAEFKPGAEPFIVTVRAKKAAEVVEVQFTLNGTYQLTCSRCGDGLTLGFEVAFEHRFVGPGSLDTDGADVGALFADDPDISEHDGLQVELEAVCIENAILAIPFAPSCIDTAAGICENWSDEPASFGDEAPEEEEDESPFAALRGVKLPENQ